MSKETKKKNLRTRRVCVYLDDDEFLVLRVLSKLHNKSTAELMRDWLWMACNKAMFGPAKF